MKRQLSNTIYGLKFAMEKNDFERLKSSSGKKRNDFVANPIVQLFKSRVQSFPIEIKCYMTFPLAEELQI